MMFKLLTGLKADRVSGIIADRVSGIHMKPDEAVEVPEEYQPDMAGNLDHPPPE